MELEKNRREHDQFNQEINNNKALISRNHDITNNEIESINANHAKLKAAHEKLKSEVEAQNKYNSDNQDSVDKALKKLNEEKNTINCDIDLIRLDFIGVKFMLMSPLGMIFGRTRTHDETKTACSPTNWTL
jgi:hypothetical protein